MAHVNVRPALRLGLVLAGAYILFAAAVPLAAGQVVDFPGGSLVLKQQGASMHVAATGSNVSVGFETLDGRTRVGATVRKRSPTFVLSLGDETVPLAFFTDVFKADQAFAARGVGVGVTRGPTTGSAFVGTSATVHAAPGPRGVRTKVPVGALFVKRTLRHRLALASDVLIAGKQTIISGLEWTPRERVRASIVAGLGANQPYLSTSLVADRAWVSLYASYVRRGSTSRPFGALRTLDPSTDRERVLVTFKPTAKLSVIAGRELRQALDPGPHAGSFGFVHHYGTALSHGPCRVSGGIVDWRTSRSQGGGRTAQAASVCGGKLQMSVAAVHGGARSPTLNTSWARDSVTHLPEMPNITTPSDQLSSMSIGGEFLTKAGTIRIGYRTLLVPPTPGSPLDRAVAVNVRVSPFGA